MSCRLDKFVWCVRLTKTRSLASQDINKGKIKLNSESAKPSREVKIGDKIQVKRHSALFSYEIMELLNKRIGAKLVSDYIIDITPGEEKEKHNLYKKAQQAYSLNESGKPTTKDRRDLNKFLQDLD